MERATGNPIFSRAVVAALAALLALTTGASAQGIRGTAVTNVRYLTLRPIQADTVARADVIEQDGVFTFEGREVFCSRSTDACIRYIPADEAHAVVATQDISATAWGLGVQGLSATVLLRGRGDLAGDLTWPPATTTSTPSSPTPSSSAPPTGSGPGVSGPCPAWASPASMGWR